MGALGVGVLLALPWLYVPAARAATSATISICDAFGTEDQANGYCANNDDDPQTYELGFVEWTVEDDGSMTVHVSANEYTTWARFGVCMPFSADIGSDSEWFRCDPTDPNGEALTDGVTSGGDPFANAGDGWYSFEDCVGEFTFVVDADHVPDTGDFRLAISIDEAPEDTDDLPPATPSPGCNVGEGGGDLPQYQYESFGRVVAQTTTPQQPTSSTTVPTSGVGDDTITQPRETLPATGVDARLLVSIAGIVLALGGAVVRVARTRGT